jgi:tetratricopeptide (TPR) repeat protein
MDLTALREQVAERLSSNDPGRALELLDPYADRLDQDPNLALLFVTLLARMPGRASLLEEAGRVLDRWPDRPDLVIAANAALIAAAERRPMDEPPLRADGPARRAADAAERCLAALSPEQAKDPKIAGYLWINRANALRLAGPDLDAEAQAAFRRAIELDPDNGSFWFDLGLLHKWRGRFADGLSAFLRARARLGETRGVQWNVAICATAVGDGDLGAGVWKSLGMPASLHPSGMPFVEGLPPMQVRVISRGAGFGPTSSFPDHAAGFEVVWVAPLSPCHGVVQSPTFRDAPVDYGDLVLWDGAPVGAAEAADGTRVPRFPLLEILRRGDERKWRFVALTEAPDRLDLLEAALPEGCLVFAQRERIESGRPVIGTDTFLVKPRDARPIDRHLVHGKLVVPAGVEASAVAAALEALQATKVGAAPAAIAVAVPELYESLGNAKRAGQEHQAALGIERRAEKRFG